MIRRFIIGTEGSSAIDYSLVAAAVSIVIVTAMTMTGARLSGALGTFFAGYN